MKRCGIGSDGFEACVDAAVEALASDQLVIALTDTVYGLLGRFNTEAVLERMYGAKKRSIDKRLIALVRDADAAQALSAIPIHPVLSGYWPGPLSVVVPAPASHPYGWDTQALRVPDDAFLQAILERLGEPLAAPSANLEGQPTVSSYEEALVQFPGDVSLFVQSDRNPSQAPSTIVSLGPSSIELLRPGVLAIPGLHHSGAVIPMRD